MSGISELLSRRPSAESIKQNLEQEPDVIAIDDEAVNDVFSALSSATARSILTTLYVQPRTASDLADEVDTSLQNVNYHLSNLDDSGLIEIVDTWYSDQGREMKVYTPTNRALVLFAGDNIHRSSLLDAIKRLLGLVGIFALSSILIGRAVRRWVSRPEVHLASAKTSGEQPVLLLPPEPLIFLGSLLALLIVSAWWHYRTA